MTSPHAGRDDGDSLIEILMAIAIMGIAFAAVLGAFATTIRGSDFHRKSADIQAALRNVSEQIKAQTFIPCAGVGAVPNYTSSGVSSELHVDVLPTEAWNDLAGDYTGACLTSSLQRVTLRACVSSVVAGGACPATGAGSQTLFVTKLKR